MYVLLTVNTTWNIWNFRQPIVDALLADGHKVAVLAPTDESASGLEKLGCRVIPLEMSVKGLNPVEDLKLVQRFKRVYRSERPDVILSYTIKNNIFGALAAQASGIPFIPTVTGLGTAFLSGRPIRAITELLYWHAFRRLPAIFFQNEDDRALFVERKLIRSDQARVLPGSGIDLARFSPAVMPPSESPIFLLIARLLRDKGIVEFVDAARHVKAIFPTARFQLLGALGAQNRTAIDAATLGAWLEEGVVEHLGTTTDVRPYIAAASCVVLPSYREGAPRTLIEAAAMGRPVIATDVPGCRSVVDRDRSGFLCNARSASSLAEAILYFLSLSQDAHAELGQAGRRKMEREFDQLFVVRSYRQAIEAVVDGG